MVVGWGGRRTDERRRRKCEKEDEEEDKDEKKICSSMYLQYPLAFIVKLLALYGIPMTQH